MWETLTRLILIRGVDRRRQRGFTAEERFYRIRRRILWLSAMVRLVRRLCVGGRDWVMDTDFASLRRDMKNPR